MSVLYPLISTTTTVLQLWSVKWTVNFFCQLLCKCLKSRDKNMSKTVTFRNVSLTPRLQFLLLSPLAFLPVVHGFRMVRWTPVHKVQINLQRLSRALHSKVQMDNNLMNFQGNLRKKKNNNKVCSTTVIISDRRKKLIYSLTTENSY